MLSCPDLTVLSKLRPQVVVQAGDKGKTALINRFRYSRARPWTPLSYPVRPLHQHSPPSRSPASISLLWWMILAYVQARGAAMYAAGPTGRRTAEDTLTSCSTFVLVTPTLRLKCEPQAPTELARCSRGSVSGPKIATDGLRGRWKRTFRFSFARNQKLAGMCATAILLRDYLLIDTY